MLNLHVVFVVLLPVALHVRLIQIFAVFVVIFFFYDLVCFVWQGLLLLVDFLLMPHAKHKLQDLLLLEMKI